MLSMNTGPPSADWEKTAASLRRQLLWERLVVGLVVLFFLGRWGFAHLAGSTCAVYADGKPIVAVENRRVAQGLLDEMIATAPGDAEDAGFAARIELRRKPSGHPLDRESALAVLRAKLTVEGDKWTVLIDGRPYAALDTKEQVGETLELARQRYGRLVANLLEEPSFKQNVTTELQKVDLRRWRRTPQEAVELLFAPEGKAGVHIVRRGEVASVIAQRYHMSLSEMRKLNPGRSLDRLQIGDRLRVGRGQAPLTVIVRDQVTRTEPMPFRTESTTSVTLYAGKRFVIKPGRLGKRQVTLAITYENGVETGREVVEEVILRDPTPKRVAVGVRPRR